MTKTSIISCLALAACISSAAQSAQISELSRYFEFPATQNRIKINNNTSDVNLPSDFSKHFTLSFLLDTKKQSPSQSELLAFGDDLNISVENNELKATIALCDSLTGDKTEIRHMTIAIPDSIIDNHKAKKEITLQYNGSQFSIYVDGRLYDTDFPIGTPAPGNKKIRKSEAIKNISLTTDNINPQRTGKPTTADIQYWTPPYHNAWVGDVAACYYQGRYHIFYLLDRRGHTSKFGKGGHYFEHISTPDLINWTEHTAATPIEHQWETFGTGTPFEHDGKLYLAYGLHTTRIYPYERTTLPELKQQFDNSGHTRAIDCDTIANAIPAGATFAVSNDGGNTFEKSNILFHFCENPSVWTDNKGRFHMYANYGAKGTWTSDSIATGWTCTDAEFPTGRDCTFPFTIGDFDYVIGGFSGMWRKPKGTPTDSFIDIVKDGQDCYDGLSVPAVTQLPDGRTLMAGWLKMRNWGGALVIHRIVMDKDGTLGSKFIEELIPDFPSIAKIKPGTPTEVPASFRYDFTFTPTHENNGKMTLKFGDSTYWILDIPANKIYYTSSPDQTQRTLAEGGDVSAAHNYAIPARIASETEIPVRVIVKHEPKYQGSIIDIEVNGNRTMTTFRPDLKVSHLTYLENKPCMLPLAQ